MSLPRCARPLSCSSRAPSRRPGAPGRCRSTMCARGRAWRTSASSRCSSASRNGCRARKAKASARASEAALGEKPVEDVLAVGNVNAGLRRAVLEGLAHVLYAMWRTAQVRMHRERHDARVLLALLVQAIELVDRAAQESIGFMLLDRHQRDVVHLEVVRQSDDRPVLAL